MREADTLNDELIAIAPFNWLEMNLDGDFDAIIGNLPYVSTEGLHALLPPLEFELYKNNYKSAYKQFDKYFIFVERAVNRIKDGGLVCYIVPNKFFKVGAGRNLRHSKITDSLMSVLQLATMTIFLLRNMQNSSIICNR